MSLLSILAQLATPLAALALFVDTAAADPRGDRDRGPGRSDQQVVAPDGGRGRGNDRGDSPADWQLLGSARVGGLGVDHDVIDVGRSNGKFEKIGVTAREGSLYLVDMVVVYANGEQERFDLRQHLKQGERTPPIDLKGRDRAVKRIEVSARVGRDSRGRAVLDVFGQEARENWELLGKQSVGFRVDHDVISVGRREGRFEKIALEVDGGDVEIRDLKVFFMRGPPQDVRVRQFIRSGQRTPPIDLAGGDRGIDRIELTYRSGARGRASVAVYGLQGSDRPGFPGRGFAGGPGFGGPPPGGPPPRADWVELGCGKTGFLPDHDTIQVGRQEGRFSAIKLAVSGNKVNILNLKVVYERGAPDDIQVGAEIKEGRESEPLDLRGERRAIKEVQLYYMAKLSLKGSAKVCVLGRQ